MHSCTQRVGTALAAGEGGGAREAKRLQRSAAPEPCGPGPARAKTKGATLATWQFSLSIA